MQSSRYTFELWSPTVLLAELSGRAKNRRVVMSRNEPEDIYWQIDLNEFEEYARSLNTTSSQLIKPGITEVRVKRGDIYLCGGQVEYRQARITPASQDIELRATGFLNLLKDRYTDAERIFTATQATTIAWTLIDESQSQGPNWDFGITQGTMATVGTHDRTYRDDEIKDSLQRLTRVQVAPFDFEFTANKVFNTYAAIGSQRPELVFEYPGNIKNIISPFDATSIANRIKMFGSGFGELEAIRTTVENTSSQANYKVREKKVLESNIIEVATLQNHGNAELAAWSAPFEIPTIEVDGNRYPYVTDYGIGDYVKVKLGQYDMLSHVDGLYRIEKIELSIDDDDSESVNLYLSR